MAVDADADLEPSLRRRAFLGGAAASLTSGLAGCSRLLGGGSGERRIRIGLSRPPSTLDPLADLDPAASLIVGQVTEGLYRYSRRLEIVPQLAAGLPEQTRGGRRWTVPISEAATFADGTPVTAEAVVQTVQRTRQRSGPESMRWSMVDAVSAIDDQTVQFDLTYAFDGFIESLFAPIVPPLDRSSADPWTTDAPVPLVGSGPFRYDSTTEDGAHQLKHTGNYWGSSSPAVDSLEFAVFTDDTRRVVALRGREVQVALDVPSAVWSTLEDVESLSFDDVPGYDYVFLGCNCAAGPTADVDVRRALHHLIDVDAVVETAVGESAARVYGPLPAPITRAWDFPRSDWQAYDRDRDIAAAGRLLDESSAVTADWDATFLVPPDDARETVCNAIAEGLLDLGYGATVRRVDWETFRDLRVTGDPEEYNVYCGGIIGGRDPDSVLLPLFGPLAAGETEGTHYQGATDAVARGRRAETRQKRRDAYEVGIQAVLADVAHIPLFTRHQSVATQNDVEAVNPHPTDGAVIGEKGPTDVAERPE